MKQIKSKLNVSKVDVEVTEDGNYRITGYASTFHDQPDSYGDIIDKKAFDNTLKQWETKQSPLPMLFNHNWENVIGHWEELETDDYGLKVTGVLIGGVQQVEDIVKFLKAGSVGSLSIGYKLNDYESLGDGTYLLKDIELYEISIVQLPANSLALIDKIKCDIANQTSVKPKYFEKLLRDVASVSNKQSKVILAQIKQRDAEEIELKNISEKIDKLLSKISKV